MSDAPSEPQGPCLPAGPPELLLGLVREGAAVHAASVTHNARLMQTFPYPFAAGASLGALMLDFPAVGQGSDLYACRLHNRTWTGSHVYACRLHIGRGCDRAAAIPDAADRHQTGRGAQMGRDQPSVGMVDGARPPTRRTCTSLPRGDTHRRCPITGPVRAVPDSPCPSCWGSSCSSASAPLPRSRDSGLPRRHRPRW